MNSSRIIAASLLFFIAPGPSSALDRGGPDEYARFLIEPSGFTRPGSVQLSSGAARADIAALRELMEQAYSGYEYFSGTGTDWAGLFSALEKEIASRPEWPGEDIFELLMSKLRAAGIRDNHFSLKLKLPDKELWDAPFRGRWTPQFSDYYVQRKKGRLLLLRRSGPAGVVGQLLKVNGGPPERYLFRTYAPGMNGEVYLLGAFSAVPEKELNCSLLDAAEELRAPLHPSRAAKGGRRPVFEDKDLDGVRYIGLGSLRDDHSAVLDKFVASAVKLRGERVILLDLRGNDGGRDGWGNAWLAGLTNGVFKSDRLIKVLIGPATLQGEINYLRENLAAAPDIAARETVYRRLQDAEKRLAQAARAGVGRHWETRVVEWPGQAPEKFRGRLVILSDGDNASAGESLLQTARGLEGAVVLGENSMGVNTFGPLYLYGLPNSGIKVYLAQGITLFSGQLRESSGMPPDIWLDEPDMLPKAVEYARSLGKNSTR